MIAVYPGTFDPITHGHRDLVERALTIFPRVIVAVALNARKKPRFSLERRLDFVQTVFASCPGVEVCSFDGLLVHFAQEKGARVLIRGLRAVSDFEYEFQLATMNRHLDPQIETILLTPAEQYAFVSSSFVTEIAALGGDMSAFVHPMVGAAMKELLWP